MTASLCFLVCFYGKIVSRQLFEESNYSFENIYKMVTRHHTVCASKRRKYCVAEQSSIWIL